MKDAVFVGVPVTEGVLVIEDVKEGVFEPLFEAVDDTLAV